MRLNIPKTDVMIVGAGLPGLVMAYQLLRLGIQPLVIDSRSSSSGTSQAVTLQARTMELFRQMGIDHEVDAHGVECKGITIHNQLNDHLRTHHFRDSNTPFPFLTVIQQDLVEHILIRQLTLKACPIYWNTSLISQKQDHDGIDVIVKSEGRVSQCQVKWMIGADGVHSKVRKLSGVSFDGNTYKRRVFLADVQMEQGEYNDLHIFLSSTVSFSIFPLPDKGQYRLMGYLSKKDIYPGNDFKRFIERVNSLIPIKRYNGIGNQSIQSRTASRFSDQRCFFIGDAAQVHSPLGGLGVNTGIQDAYNLSWKLANVLRGKQNATLLHSYDYERRLATAMFKKADRIVGILVNSPGIMSWLINRVFHVLFQNGRIKNYLLSGFNQTAIEYRASHLSVHHSVSSKIKAGDRIPYLPVFDERTKTETDLHRWCNKPGFILLLMGNINSGQLLIMARWLRQKYTHYMHLYYLPFSDRNQAVFDAFDLKKGGHRMILIRPDMHIAYIQDVISANLIDNYMTEIMRWEF